MNTQWAQNWIIETLRQEGVNITTGIIADVNRSLNIMAQDKDRLPTIETLMSIMKNEEAKAALSKYTQESSHGKLSP